MEKSDYLELYRQMVLIRRLEETASADHRITDDAEASRFMQHLALFLKISWRLLKYKIYKVQEVPITLF